jgi:hypothetical protein
MNFSDLKKAVEELTDPAKQMYSLSVSQVCLQQPGPMAPSIAYSILTNYVLTTSVLT